MDQEGFPTPDTPKEPRVDGGERGLSTWTVILVVLLVLVIIGAIYYYFLILRKPSKTATTTSTTTTTPTTKTTPTSTTGTTGTSDTKTAQKIASDFENAVMEQDSATIKSLLAAQVNLIEEATECCGDVTAQEAVQSMGYLKDTKTLDFLQTSALVKKIKAQNPKLQDYTLGVDDSKEVFGYHLNSQNRVDKIYMSVSYEILGVN